MPGPKSTPNGTVRNTKQYVPAVLKARLADYEKTIAGSKNPKLSFIKPGSQK